MPLGFEEVLKNRSIFFAKNAKTDQLSTFRIGGTCAYLIEPGCLGELIEAVSLCEHEGMAYKVIGRGSNILFSDGHLPMALIRTTRLDGWHREGNNLIVDCGISLPRLSRLAALLGFGDLAFACGIPGTVGGGAFMNAGAHGKALENVVKWIRTYDPEEHKIRTFFNKELSFSYRNSIFQRNKSIILQICLSLSDPQKPTDVMQEMRAYLLKRSTTQPLTYPSAGSVFRRRSAGEPVSLILDELGLKGMRCGNAAVSVKHAGFIVNLGGATAEDVQTLITVIQGIVKRKRGFVPEVEIEIVSSEGRR